jgi:hypothetical protein
VNKLNISSISFSTVFILVWFQWKDQNRYRLQKDFGISPMNKAPVCMFRVQWFLTPPERACHPQVEPMLGSYNYRRSDDSDIICGSHDEVLGLLVSRLFPFPLHPFLPDPSSPYCILHHLYALSFYPIGHISPTTYPYMNKQT